MTPRVVTIKGLILVQEVAFRDQAAVYVTILEIEDLLPLMMDVW